MSDVDTRDSLSVWTDIHATLKGIRKWTDFRHAIDQAKLNRMGKSAVIPADIRLVGQATVANTVAVVALTSPVGSPDQGHVWLLRNIVVGRGDAALATALAGAAYVVVAPSPPNPAALGWTGVKDAFNCSALGPPQHYSSRQIVVKSEEYLYVVITGGTNGQVAFAQADVEDVQESAAQQSFDIG